MPTAKETYQGGLTRGILSPRDSYADPVVHVTGLDGGRDNLDTAIDTAIGSHSGESTWLVHPDDATLPLRSARAVWHRGADNGSNAEALVFLTYDKRSSGEAADATEFSNIADVNLRYEKILWWGDTLEVPAAAGTPEAITLQSDPRARNAAVKMPRPNWITVPIMDVFVPVVLSSSPINSVKSTAGKINDGAVTLSGSSFAANSILFNGLRQRATKIDDGTSVTYEFSVGYSFSIREDGWYRSLLVEDAGDYKADKELMYDAATFPTFPTS